VVTNCLAFLDLKVDFYGYEKSSQISLLAIALGIVFAAAPNEASAQDAMIGEIRIFAGDFAPRGYALCHGQLLPIQANRALFDIIGTTYGGDGKTSFALPDLRGRTVVGASPAVPRGARGTGQVPKKAAAGAEAPRLAINYIICIQGIFPARS
jgi:microcystin-dependent protein